MSDVPILLLIGVTSTLGALLISQAYRSCEAAVVAPFEYISMPLAILMGLVVFGEWPDLTAWIGIALICGAGLYVVWRETRAAPLVPPLAAAPAALRSAAVEGRDAG
jgi:drug/metabolite transporter (DMT)-like permease